VVVVRCKLQKLSRHGHAVSFGPAFYQLENASRSMWDGDFPAFVIAGGLVKTSSFQYTSIRRHFIFPSNNPAFIL
jgi:hypothetical protein